VIPGLAFVFTFQFGQQPSVPDRWFSVDKAKHFFTAAFVQSVSFGASRTVGLSHSGSLVVATAVTATVSVGKEIYDRGGRGTVSAKDLVWDAAGMVAASELLWRTER
jgi:uncharacterized protein YfiM (DUF2279 family)